MGRVQTVTSYQGVGGPGSTIVNQVFDAYDGWGHITQEWQNPDGGFTLNGNAPPSVSPTVSYSYADEPPAARWPPICGSKA